MVSLFLLPKFFVVFSEQRLDKILADVDFPPTDNSPPGEHRTVAPELWIYFVVTLPVTITILVGWWLWDHKRENQFRLEDKNIDKEIHDMEKECIKSMRQRNLSRYETWGTKKRETFMTF